MKLPFCPKPCGQLSIVFYICLFALLLPYFALSMEQSRNCHCFRDRVFDPANRFISDDYLLTTVGNALIASHFGISKRQIVMMKMQGGAENNDLLIALYLKNLSVSDAKDILKAKKQTTWQDFASADASLKTMQNDPIVNQIRLGTEIEQVCREIMQMAMLKRFAVQNETLSVLQQKNLSPRETALILTLAEHTGVPPNVIAYQNKSNGLSWSEIAHNFGLQPAEAGELVLSPANTANMHVQ